jgi:hypothetical protein
MEARSPGTGGSRINDRGPLGSLYTRVKEIKSRSAKAWLQAASWAVRGFAVSKHSASCKVDWSRLQNLSNAGGYFTLGSTKDEVLAAQGTPTEVGEYRWSYGLSTVNFRNDRVTYWKVIYGSPLKGKE